MERRITEEQATKALLDWLEQNYWEVICYDFPQSGTGVSLHPNEELRTTKNKRAFIPDIVAVKDHTVVFFENKDRFVLDDFLKVQDLRRTRDYSNSIDRLLADYNYSKIFYGVGLVHSKSTLQKMMLHSDKVDFAVVYYINKLIEIPYDPYNIFD